MDASEVFDSGEVAIFRVTVAETTPISAKMRYHFDFERGIEGPPYACLTNWLMGSGIQFHRGLGEPVVDPLPMDLAGIHASARIDSLDHRWEVRAGGVEFHGPAELLGTELEPEDPGYIILGLDQADEWLSRGAGLDFELNTPEPSFKVTRVGSGSMDCRARLAEFDGGPIVATPGFTEANDLEFRFDVQESNPRLVWAWVAADQGASVELVGPEGNLVAQNETTAFPGHDAIMIGCVHTPGEWTLQIPHLRSGSQPFAYAAVTDLPGMDIEAMGCEPFR
jgi:hypothetical protein